MGGKRQYYVTILLALAVYVANTQWIRPVPGPDFRQASGVQFGPGAQPGPGQDNNKFIGSASCAACHKDIYNTHIQTAHYRDSRPAARETIRGSFDEEKNRFSYNQHMEVVMEKKGHRFFQAAYFNGTLLEREAFDIVIGSGRKGQSYLYWDSIRLFQLPISWYGPSDSWCNSPGYPSNIIYFNKQVHGQCMECHSTYSRAEEQDVLGTVFDKKRIIYGIDCEKCHGPGADHVSFHQSHPGEKTGHYIINARLLGRQQRLDACALCHSGLRKPLQPAFSFTVGDTLDKFSSPAYDTDSVSTLDVHANQYGLLTSSKCFQKSQMDCSSCHNVHVTQINDPQLFAQRCMTCHNDAAHSACTSPIVRQQSLYSNCIDCHMPRLPSGKILLQVSVADSAAHDFVRTHHIGFYPDAVKAFLEKLKTGPRR